MLLDLIDYITCFCGWFQYAQKMGMFFFNGVKLPMKLPFFSGGFFHHPAGPAMTWPWNIVDPMGMGFFRVQGDAFIFLVNVGNEGMIHNHHNHYQE